MTLVFALLAQTPPTQNQPWTAHWISAPDFPQKDEVVLHFRKVIRLSQKPEHFLVDVTADNQFIFYVNQQRVGSGPSHSDLAHWRYETYDLAPLLHEGQNILAATVWNFGTHAAVRQMSDRIGFLVHGESAAERIADTDLTWEVAQEKAIETIQPQMTGYYAAGPGEQLDGRKFDWQWSTGSQSNTSWKKPTSLGHNRCSEQLAIGRRSAPTNAVLRNRSWPGCACDGNRPAEWKSGEQLYRSCTRESKHSARQFTADHCVSGANCEWWRRLDGTLHLFGSARR